MSKLTISYTETVVDGWSVQDRLTITDEFNVVWVDLKGDDSVGMSVHTGGPVVLAQCILRGLGYEVEIK